MTIDIDFGNLKFDDSPVVCKCGLCGQEWRYSSVAVIGVDDKKIGFSGTTWAKCEDGSLNTMSFCITNSKHDICPECAIKQGVAVMAGYMGQIPSFMKQIVPRGGY